MAASRRRIRRNRRNNRNARVSKRTIRDRLNPIEYYTQEEVFERYRFRPPTIMYIIGRIYNDLKHGTNKNCALPPLLQLLTCLRFLATGAFHKLVGDSIGISESTIGRCCRAVCDAVIANMLNDSIKFPTDRRARETKQEFLHVAGFPNVLGCIDSTFVRIIGPKENEPDYVNRKGFHSLNVQKGVKVLDGFQILHDF